MTVTHEIPSYAPPKKLALVLSCVDYRLLDDIVNYLHVDNMTNRYYHFALAGTSLGLTNAWTEDYLEPEEGDIKSLERANVPTKEHLCSLLKSWWPTFEEQVKAGLILSKGAISDIYIIQHEDCGAYKIYLDKDFNDKSVGCQKEVHARHAFALAEHIDTNFEEIYFKTFHPHLPADANTPEVIDIKRKLKNPEIHTLFMDLRGRVTLLEKPKKKPKSSGKGAKGS